MTKPHNFINKIVSFLLLSRNKTLRKQTYTRTHKAHNNYKPLIKLKVTSSKGEPSLLSGQDKAFS
jgi:hypothetical protein